MTLSPEVLSGLRERLSLATEGDGELERDIAIALGWTPPAMGLPYWHDHDGNHWSALPDWSTSIDDALALTKWMVPGCKVQIFVQPDDRAGARLRTKDWRTFSSFEHYDEETDPIRYQANGALAVILVLVLALLTALQENMK